MARLSKILLGLFLSLGLASAGTWISSGKGSHGGTGLVTTAFTDTLEEFDTTANPVTFVDAATGTASASRITAITVSFEGRPSVSTVTINGVTATKLAGNTAGGASQDVWAAANPSGTTGNIVLTFGSAVALRLGVGVYAVTGANTTPSDTDSNAGTGLNSIQLTGLTVPTNGGAIIGAACTTQMTAITWTNAVEDFDIDTGVRATAARTATVGTATITADGADGAAYAMAGVAWGPL